MLFSATLTAPILVAWIYREPSIVPYLQPMFGSFVLGLALYLAGLKRDSGLTTRDGFLIVTLFWVLVSVLGAWPFMAALVLGPVDALFESASGFTTTGATVIVDLDQLPRSLLFYRQQIQWLGGMGVVVLGLAVIPILGIGGMQLYRAEAPGPLKDEKLTPRLAKTARSLWLLYLVLTLSCALCYWLAGMDGFDAIAHSLSTVSTGGFSTHDDSLGYFDSEAIEIVAVLFMLLAAINFGVHFLVWMRRDPRLYLHDPEARAFLIFVAGTVLLVGLMLWADDHSAGLHLSLRGAAFEVVSLVTSTGYGIVDYSAWPDFLPILLIVISFVGGCGGSTAGGIKVVRVVLLMKQGLQELKRLIHPHAILKVRLGHRVVEAGVIQAVWGYFALYIVVFTIMSLLMIHAGLDPISAFAAVATSLNNLGPGLGEVALNFASVSDSGKSLAVIAMILGRLEIFTILVMLSPEFWRP
ncbi:MULTISPECIES: TrkH family potassium uptake protein [Thiorhodovibrio]|uniref:TrkH family potassium uptake protein n=1 Tax=Thiorhodovibrio TaxID=61593 RepID=UPI001913265B|nr:MULTISPECIES: TrkH family potassium uptake protein [Thiorhodovibrio]WPL14449.1 Trk system potassium uptake protein TrkH [Thiorhodovibrio litoralis]